MIADQQANLMAYKFGGFLFDATLIFLLLFMTITLVKKVRKHDQKVKEKRAEKNGLHKDEI